MAVRVLAVGGVDSSGGAGLFADLRAVEALGARFVSATTALTAQNERGVLSVQPSSLDQFANELRAAFCRRVHAVKTGMLASAAHVGVLCAALDAMGFGGPIVVDPVLAATHGGKLIDAAGIEAMQKALFPRAALITPNLPEAEAFAGCADEPAALAARLSERWGAPVLLTGGHAEDDPVRDWLASPKGELVAFVHPRRKLASSRGTGCRLASAIAVRLARAEPLPEAVARAIEWLTGSVVRVERGKADA